MSDEYKLFQAVFNHSPVGLVIVNNDTSLRDANKYMFEMFGISYKDIKGERFGNVFNCITINQDHSMCGTKEECAKCGLRTGVTAVLENDLTISNTNIDHWFNLDGIDQKKWFKISASRVTEENDSFAIVSFVDITSQKEYENLLKNQLSLDLATGTVNKHTLIKTLSKLTTGNQDMVIAMVDFDNFKAINDQHGHMVGDKVLTIFSSTCFSCLRRQDIVGRFGGDEFILIFIGEYSDSINNILKRISNLFQATCYDDLKIKPTLSAGLAAYSNKMMHPFNVEEIISEADRNLYISKNSGKNRITFGSKITVF